MGFLSQIVNKFLPTKPHSTSADGWENPFALPSGQVVTSQNENWQARLSRLGKTRSIYTGKIAMTQGTSTTVTSYGPSGAQAFFTHASISTDGPGFALMGTTVGNTSNYYSKYLPAAGSFEVKLDGVFSVGTGGSFYLMFKADNAGTNAVGSMIWLEVEE